VITKVENKRHTTEDAWEYSVVKHINPQKAYRCRVQYALHLRDLADKDYISARMSYRVDLTDQFLWSGLQALEKYLKATLLFNNVSTLKLSHRLDKAFQKLLDVHSANFDFSEGMAEFIEYLGDYGNNRYWEFPSHTGGYELSYLDLAVWNIRRYCQPITETGVYALLNSPEVKKNRHEVRLARGFLESVLVEERKRDLRKALVWKNGCYGSRSRNVIRNYPVRIVSTNPVQFRDPECYFALKDYVQFPKDVKHELEKLASSR
jgi:HEPN domain-containing protein